ncbi:MAG: hypothetical protein AB4911_05095 [Oscillochloridaceae bacterium umkhey_bin13]
MIIDIELTRRSPEHYSARALQFPDIKVEASSREAALMQIREVLIARRQAGVEIVQITLEPDKTPLPAAWPRHAGAFPDDDAFHTMLAEVERQRRLLDEETPS